jgi:hypothetical protein
MSSLFTSPFVNRDHQKGFKTEKVERQGRYVGQSVILYGDLIRTSLNRNI